MVANAKIWSKVRILTVTLETCTSFWLAAGHIPLTPMHSVFSWQCGGADEDIQIHSIYFVLKLVVILQDNSN